MKSESLGEWPFIPENAFLYFPQGVQVKEGTGESQWRKIFGGGIAFDDFEKTKLKQLQSQLLKAGVSEHLWFDEPNKLRFLQANKFSVSSTVNAIKQSKTWRETKFPINQTSETLSAMNSGAIYVCGRDKYYRPIIVISIEKLKKYSQTLSFHLLSTIMQFTTTELMIEGQVQNYIMIVNLEGTGISDKSSITDIINFNSSTYRGRLFRMYLVNAPMMISSTWDSVISKLLPENTVKKIKVAKKKDHPEMWDHIDKEQLQQRYGGIKQNLSSSFWPVSVPLVSAAQRQPSNQTSVEEYIRLYHNGELKNRKVKSSLIQSQGNPQGRVASQPQIPTPFAGSSSIRLKSIQPLLKYPHQVEPIIKQRNFNLFIDGPTFKNLLIRMNPKF